MEIFNLDTVLFADKTMEIFHGGISQRDDENGKCQYCYGIRQQYLYWLKGR